jgi:hypothetical protein
MLQRGFGKQQNLSLAGFSLPPIAPKTGMRPSCRLPINLRSFLAAQLGCPPEASDEIILNFAAAADQATLNRLARAIRRYSTARAHEAWAECSLAITTFVRAHRDGRPVTLCLRCVRVAFDDAEAREHQRNRCVAITLARTEASPAAEISADEVAEKIQHAVERFRALRTAFGLPHCELDCYVRGEHLTLMWRPLP